jgi:urease accessory protein
VIRDAAARADPRHYSSPWIPPEALAFETPVDGLGVGGVGKVGLLELGFCRRGAVTRLAHHVQQSPLQIVRPLFLDTNRPGMAFVHVVQVGGGLLHGDRYRLDVACGPDAEAHVTTQAATKVYRMERNYATQVVNLTARADAILEYLPDPVIPFCGARFCQYTRLAIDPTATAILGEVVLPGRAASGERHAYDLFASRTEAFALDGRLLFADTILLCPGRTPLDSPGRFGGYDVLGTLHVVSRRTEPRQLAHRLAGLLADRPGIMAGASELPDGCGVSVRFLAADSAAARAALTTAWHDARLALIGTPAPDLRKG